MTTTKYNEIPPQTMTDIYRKLPEFNNLIAIVGEAPLLNHIPHLAVPVQSPLIAAELGISSPISLTLLDSSIYPGPFACYLRLLLFIYYIGVHFIVHHTIYNEPTLRFLCAARGPPHVSSVKPSAPISKKDAPITKANSLEICGLIFLVYQARMSARLISQ